MKKILYSLCLFTITFASCNWSSKNTDTSNVEPLANNIPLVERPFYVSDTSKYILGDITKTNISAKYPALSKHVNALSDGKIQLVKEVDEYPTTILVLQENKPYWICPDSISSKSINRFLGFCGNVTHYSTKIQQGRGATQLTTAADHRLSSGDETKNEINYILSNGDDVEELLFYEQTEEISYNDNTSFMSNTYLIAPYDQLLYGKKKNNKYNIFAYELNQDSLNFTLYAYLPTDADAINSLKATTDYAWDSHQGAFIYQQGELYGIFPGTTQAKYASVGNKLDTQAKLCRYTLPSGTSGWLDIETGLEYPDI